MNFCGSIFTNLSRKGFCCSDRWEDRSG